MSASTSDRSRALRSSASSQVSWSYLYMALISSKSSAAAIAAAATTASATRARNIDRGTTAEPSRSNWTVRDADSAVSCPIIDTGLSAS